MKIEVFGTGCAKCEKLAAAAEANAQKLGLDYELVKVTQLAQITQRGIMLTPALAIDGEVKAQGAIPSDSDLSQWLTSAATS